MDDGIRPLLPYKRRLLKRDFLRNMNTLTMNTMTVIYVLITVHWSIVQQTGMGTGNIKAAERYVRPAPI